MTQTRMYLFDRNKKGGGYLLLRITNTPDGQDIFLTDNNRPLEYQGNIYKPYFFRFVPPTQDKDSNGAATLQIGAADQTIITLVRSIDANNPAQLQTMAVYVERDGDTGDTGDFVFDELDNYIFDIMTANWTAGIVELQLGFASILTKQFPPHKFTQFNTEGAA